MNTEETQIKNAWENSYNRQENHVFYPADEVVRFVARYLRRRISIDEVIDVMPGTEGSRIIDVGCGIGRNMIFGSEMGFDMYGCDLSSTAIAVAKEWLSRKPATNEEKNTEPRVVVSDIQALPWDNAFFDHAISDSVLDSMPFQVAQVGVTEISRIIKPDGYFYCSLISGDESGREASFCGEEIVDTTHERNTIQSYFNRTKIRRLLEPLFEILSCQLHQINDPLNDKRSGRWHVVSRRREL